MDYSRLNREMSQTETTMSPEGAAKTAATLAALEDIEEDELPKLKPAVTIGNKEVVSLIPDNHSSRVSKYLGTKLPIKVFVAIKISDILQHFLIDMLDSYCIK